jgi:hypothetical protein
MNTKHFVGREQDIKQLGSVLTGKLKAAGQLTVQSVSGPGGIGKTTLFNHVLSRNDISGRKYLTLRIDGSEGSGKNLLKLVSQMIDKASATAIQGRPSRFFFSATDEVIKNIESIKDDAAAEFRKNHPEDKGGEAALNAALDLIFETGKTFNEAIPITKKTVNFQKLEEVRPILDIVIPKLDSLKAETAWFWEKLGIGGSTALRNAIKNNACSPLADALVSDLSAILQGYKAKDVLMPKHKKLEGIDRLLLVIDDYETVQGSAGEFLVSHFLPALRNANFETTAIIMGRDQLEATHPSWDQHLMPCMEKRIELSSLSKLEVYQMVEAFEIYSEEEKERAWNDTSGYPFYVQLWVEEAESGGRSAVMLKRFYDRTTRWMSDQQKIWLQQVLFLDAINQNTLEIILNDAEEANLAFEWFKNEGSVRDTTSKKFRVREYLRSRLLDYLEISTPKQYNRLKQRSISAGLIAAQMLPEG